MLLLALAAPSVLYPLLRGERPAEVHLILLDPSNNPVSNAELTFYAFDEQVILPIPWSSGRRVRGPIHAVTDHTGYCRIRFHAKHCSLEEVIVAGERRKPARQHDFGRDPLTPTERTERPQSWGGPRELEYVTQVWIQ